MKEKYTSADDIGMSTFSIITKLDRGLKASGFYDLAKWHVYLTSYVLLGRPNAPISMCIVRT